MRWSIAFLARFLVLAAILFALWSIVGLSDWYARAVVLVANPVIWVVTGFRVTEVVPGHPSLDLIITRGADSAVMPLDPRQMFSGLIPFLALVGSAGRVPLARRLRAVGLGMAILFLFHAGLLVIGPFFTGGPQGNMPREWVRPVNVLVDVVYGFYGLVGFAALPFLLWFWLGREESPEEIAQEEEKGGPPPPATGAFGDSLA